jgi:plasmid stability protein
MAKSIVMHIDAELHRMLKIRAAQEKRTMQELVTWAVEDFLAKPLPEVPAAPSTE